MGITGQGHSLDGAEWDTQGRGREWALPEAVNLDCSVNDTEHLLCAAQMPGSSSGLNRRTLCPHGAWSPWVSGATIKQGKTEMSHQCWKVQHRAWEGPTQTAGVQRTHWREGDLKDVCPAKSWPPKCHIRIPGSMHMFPSIAKETLQVKLN